MRRGRSVCTAEKARAEYLARTPSFRSAQWEKPTRFKKIRVVGLSLFKHFLTIPYHPKSKSQVPGGRAELFSPHSGKSQKDLMGQCILTRRLAFEAGRKYVCFICKLSSGCEVQRSTSHESRVKRKMGHGECKTNPC